MKNEELLSVDRYMNLFGFKRNKLKDIFKEKEGKEYKDILILFNGFNIDKNNDYITSFSELKAVFNNYKLDIDYIYEDVTKRPFYNYDNYVYVHKGFIIAIKLSNNINELCEFILDVCSLVDNLLNGISFDDFLFYYVPQRYQIQMFNIFAEYLPVEKLIEIGRSLYISSDYGSNLMESDIVKKIFANTLEELNGLIKEDFITVYRGVGSKSKSFDEAFSWTLNEDVAKFFATRFKAVDDIENIKVYKLNINKKDIIGYISGREEEVIIEPVTLKKYLNKIEEVEFNKNIIYQIPVKRVNNNSNNKFIKNENKSDTNEEDFTISEDLLKLFDSKL